MIGILVCIAVPIFNKQLEKSREITDLANLRSAYSAARYLSATREFTVKDANGENPRTWAWEGNYVLSMDGMQGRQHFFYDPPSEKIFYTCPSKPCGKGTSLDAGTSPTFFGKGEYKGEADVTKANIVIFFERAEDGGNISVYFGYADGDAVIQHP